MSVVPDWLILWFGVAGGSAIILGARAAGFLLLGPAAIRYIVIPVLPPLPGWIGHAIILVVILLVVLFGAILLLQRIVNALFGPHAGGHVAGTYLVRTFDAVGGVVLALAVAVAVVIWLSTLF